MNSNELMCECKDTCEHWTIIKYIAHDTNRSDYRRNKMFHKRAKTYIHTKINEKKKSHERKKLIIIIIHIPFTPYNTSHLYTITDNNEPIIIPLLSHNIF